jgi:hypothetical protein
MGFFDTGQQPEQRRLADAVLADEPEPLPGAGRQRKAVEDDPRPVGEDKVLGVQGKRRRHTTSPALA